MSETTSAATVAAEAPAGSAAPDTSVMTDHVSEVHAVERPEETSTGIRKPAWMIEEAKGQEEKRKDSPTEKPATEVKAADSGPDAGKTATEEGKAGEDKPIEGAEVPATKEHPKGYVPVAAVQEARAENKLLRIEVREHQAKIVELEQQVQAKQAEPAKAAEFADFKVLADEDLELLAEDDPLAAAKYAKQLIKYERHMAQQEATREQRAAEEHKLKVQRQVAIDRIREVLPSQEKVDELSLFAVDLGLPAAAFFLTDPGTMVMPPGQKEAMPLNQIAADLVALIAKAKEAAAGKDVSKLSIDEIPESLKEAIIAEAQEKILNKVKDKGRARSVSTLPSSNRDAGNRFGGKSYKDLSPEERREYMGGIQ